jgi:hypothetical protein
MTKKYNHKDFTISEIAKINKYKGKYYVRRRCLLANRSQLIFIDYSLRVTRERIENNGPKLMEAYCQFKPTQHDLEKNEKANFLTNNNGLHEFLRDFVGA